jgi:hypothetical protein
MANTRQARRKTGSEKDRLGERQARRKTGSEKDRLGERQARRFGL